MPYNLKRREFALSQTRNRKERHILINFLQQHTTLSFKLSEIVNTEEIDFQIGFKSTLKKKLIHDRNHMIL
jgi:hypothetical protein